MVDKELGPRLERADAEDNAGVAHSAMGTVLLASHGTNPGGRIEDLGPAFPNVEADYHADSLLVLGSSSSFEPSSAGGRSERERAASSAECSLGGRVPRYDSKDDWGDFDDKSRGRWPGPGTDESNVVSSIRAALQASSECLSHDRPRGPGGQPSKGEHLALLVGMAGADCGEYVVKDREASIGRALSSDILLTDHSVSREHARLLRQDDAFLVVDLRSANGTFVNGQRVDRAKVRSGDEIGFGNARFRLVMTGDVVRPVEACGAPVLPNPQGGIWARLRGSPHFRSVLISASILTITILVTVVTVVGRSIGRGEPLQKQLFHYYLEGVEAFKRRDWVAAETRFSIMIGLDHDNERARRYLEEIARERRFEGLLTAARASRDQRDLAQAYAQASSIVDSMYTPEAEVILRGIEAELDARVARARTTLEAGRPKEALNLLGGVDEVRPGRADVLVLRERAVEALAAARGLHRESSVVPRSSGVSSEPSTGRRRTLAE